MELGEVFSWVEFCRCSAAMVEVSTAVLCDGVKSGRGACSLDGLEGGEEGVSVALSVLVASVGETVFTSGSDVGSSGAEGLPECWVVFKGGVTEGSVWGVFSMVEALVILFPLGSIVLTVLGLHPAFSLLL